MSLKTEMKTRVVEFGGWINLISMLWSKKIIFAHLAPTHKNTFLKSPYENTHNTGSNNIFEKYS